MTKHISGESTDGVEQILGAALVAFGQGAGRARLEPLAIECFRSQCAEKVRVAVGQPNWHADWRREKVYLLAWAEAAGRRSARLAAEDGRTMIVGQDVERARMKLRGYMPVASRWCPM
jgi:hypothetical protein